VTSKRALTVTVILTVWLNVPLVPVTVSVYVPVGVEAPTEIVRVDVAEPPEGGVTEVGLKVLVVPVGRPEIERLTAELKPLKDVIVIVEVPEAPCVIVKDDGEADIVKSGAAVTVRLTLTVWVSVPLVPVTVSV